MKKIAILLLILPFLVSCSKVKQKLSISDENKEKLWAAIDTLLFTSDTSYYNDTIYPIDTAIAIEETVYPFMDIYNEAKRLYTSYVKENKKGKGPDKNVYISGSDEYCIYYSDDRFEYAGTVYGSFLSYDDGGGTDEDGWQIETLVKHGPFVKYWHEIPVEFSYYRVDELIYRQQISGYALNGPYSLYKDGVLVESGTSYAWAWGANSQKNKTKEILEQAKFVAIMTLAVASALGGHGGGIGGMGSLKSKYDGIWEDCTRDGIITYYNSDGSINHTSQYDWGKEIK